jgi:hypothetical protein
MELGREGLGHELEPSREVDLHFWLREIKRIRLIH